MFLLLIVVYTFSTDWAKRNSRKWNGPIGFAGTEILYTVVNRIQRMI